MGQWTKIIPKITKIINQRETQALVSPKTFVIGVTIGYRSSPTFLQSINSLKESGFDCPHLFFEPNVDIPSYIRDAYVYTIRPCVYGAWKNWLSSLNDLIRFYPNVDCYGIMQDDIIYSLGLKDYLQKSLWPNDNCGLVSAYCPSHYHVKSKGWIETNYGNSLWAACTYFMTPNMAKSIIKWEFGLKYNEKSGIDNVVGKFCKENNFIPYYHKPSLAQHIGQTSSIWGPKNRASGKRAADDFIRSTNDL